MTAKTFIVHGPRACGKTYNRELIAARLGIPKDRIIDDFWRVEQFRAGHLHLTNDPGLYEELSPSQKAKTTQIKYTSLGMG